MNLTMDDKKTTVLYYCGVVGFIAALFNWSWLWFAASVFLHVVIFSLFSAVVHRYFCHRAYEANPTLMWFLSCIVNAYGFPPPMGYAYLHTAHHDAPDTDLDPHIGGWKELIRTAYRLPPARYARAGKWFFNAKHRWLKNNNMLLVLFAAACFIVFSTQALMWLYLVPVFTLHLCKGLHRAFSHGYDRSGPKNFWWLEYIVPLGGDWIHVDHHVDQSRGLYSKKWFELDTGGMLVKVLAKAGTIR